MRLGEPFGVLLDEFNVFQGVRHINREGGLGVLFGKPSTIFTTLEPSGKGLPLPGMPSLCAAIIVSFAAITFKSCSSSEAG